MAFDGIDGERRSGLGPLVWLAGPALVLACFGMPWFGEARGGPGVAAGQAGAKGAGTEPLRVLKRLVDGDAWTLAESLASRRGDPAFVIDGPPLKRPLTVPFWIDASGWYDVFKCLDDLRLDAFALDAQRIYLVEQVPLCGGHECRVYSIASESFSEPAHCLSGPTGGRTDIQPLGGDLYFVYGYMEGPGTGEVIRWTPEAGQTALLTHITAPDLLTRSGDDFVIRSNCDPLTGAVPAQESNPDCRFTSRCDYCVATYGRTFTWRWRPGSPPTRLAALSEGR